MKSIFFLLVGLFLVSFTGDDETMEGLWMGAFKSEVLRESMVVKFVSDNEMELYQGEVEDENKLNGTYFLQGDTAIVLSYWTSEGQKIAMHGAINKRKNFVEGNWETADKKMGEFFLRKQKIQEMIVQP